MRTSARLGEEGEVHPEVLVLPGRRAGLVEQLLEVLLAVGRQPVDDLGSTADRAFRRSASSVMSPRASRPFRHG